MTLDSQVSTEYVKSLLATAAEQGCDIEVLLADLNIAMSDIEDSYNFSSLKYGQLYQRVMRVVQDECFGMMSGGKVRLGSFRLMCLTVIQCDNLLQALIRSGEFSEICRGFRVRAIVETIDGNDKLVRLRMAGIRSLPQAEFDQLMSQANADKIRTSLTVWHSFNCWLIGQEIPLDNVSFRFDCPDSFRELAETFPAPIRFNQSFNGFEFKKSFLEKPVVQNAKSLDEFLRSAPYHLVIRDSIRKSVASKVRTILSKDVSESMFGAENVASQLNLSVTTLRRHLQLESTSFQKLKDECRLEAAIHYLGFQDLSNAQIAQRLGFDEPSTFFRAFKKWTGLTPGEYRKQLFEY
jgi:AraC-like DNA-binding protein